MKRLIILSILFIAGNGFAQSQSLRRDVLSRIAAIPVRSDFAIVAAKIRTGTDTTDAYRQLDTLLSRAYGDMFWMYGCAGLYYATQDVLRPEYKTLIRSAWKHHTPYRGDTENHFLMYYGSLLLMSQAWPNLEDTEWFMGKSSKEIYNESKEYLDHWIDETVRYGMTEWSSPRYGYYYITPLVLLTEYTKDLRMKHRFEMMLEYLLADYASDYLNGCYCGAHSRVSDQAAIDPRSAEIASYGEYFFEDSVKHLLPDLAYASMTNFTCPDIIRQIANDRSQPYEQFSFRRGRQMIRNMDQWSIFDSSYDSAFHAPVYKYDYMTKDFCLGSIQGGIVQPIQQQSWSLVFNSNKPNNIITGLNPYVSSNELGMFFPEYPHFQLEHISQSKASYTNENKWVGGSPYEWIYQDKNVLVALYDLPDSEQYHHADVYLPLEVQGMGTVEQRGIDSMPAFAWQIISFDSTEIAFCPMGPNFITKDSNGIRIRLSGGRTGYVLYCDHNFGLNKFYLFDRVHNEWLARNRREFASWVDWTAHKIESPMPLHHTQKEDAQLLFHSPYLDSKKGSGILTMRYKGETLILNFNR